MNANIVHLIGKLLLNLEQDLGASLEHQLGVLNSLRREILQVLTYLRLQTSRIFQKSQQVALLAASLQQLLINEAIDKVKAVTDQRLLLSYRVADLSSLSHEQCCTQQIARGDGVLERKIVLRLTWRAEASL